MSLLSIDPRVIRRLNSYTGQKQPTKSTMIGMFKSDVIGLLLYGCESPRDDKGGYTQTRYFPAQGPALTLKTQLAYVTIK